MFRIFPINLYRVSEAYYRRYAICAVILSDRLGIQYDKIKKFEYGNNLRDASKADLFYLSIYFQTDHPNDIRKRKDEMNQIVHFLNEKGLTVRLDLIDNKIEFVPKDFVESSKLKKILGLIETRPLRPV